MANAQHLKILKEGVAAWNHWREVNELASPDLTSANLKGEDLRGAHLNDADLSRADLTDARLSDADLKGARMDGARINGSDLSRANLTRVTLAGAHLVRANLMGVRLVRANLSGARLWATNLTRCDLTSANLMNASFGATVLADVDLSQARGLDSAEHKGPSNIGIDSLYKSQGRIPDNFLRGAGVPEEILDIAHSIRNGPPVQWHSCFISHSTKDDKFARRLYSRMKETNMRVWFAPEDLESGKKLHEQLFDAIHIQDKLLLVLSTNSIKSEWVMTEIRKAREVEKKEKRRKLFPIRLVRMDALLAWTCFDADTGKDLAIEVREYFIPDFSNWKDQDAFEEAFKRLQKDLKTDPPRIM